MSPASSHSPGNPLLAGVRVVDVSRLLPGPYCSLMLAQLGAEVIKVEEPQGGDYARALDADMFELVNRGKRSIALDLRKAEDVDAFARLVATADVVLESFRPGVMDKLGCGYETLKAINPRLVYAALTGYGQDGPYRDRAGHDINYLGYAGVLDQIGEAGTAPSLSNVQIADLAGGALHCAIGILAALIGARASGQGSFVDASMLDGSLALNIFAMGALRRGAVAPRGEDMLTGGEPWYRVYACADEGYVALGALEPKFRAAFCAAVQRPDLAALQGSALREALTQLFASRTRAQWRAQLEGVDACASVVLRLDEAIADPQVQARRLIEDLGGKPAAGSGLRFGRDPLPALGAAPVLGEATAELLASLRSALPERGANGVEAEVDAGSAGKK